VLVTGAGGFVGRHVVIALLDHGYPVVVLLRQSTLPQQVLAKCKGVVLGDIRDPRIQEETLRQVEVVCHLAAHIPSVVDDLQEAALCYQVNAKATLELAIKAAYQGIRRFVHLSAGNMYAPSKRPCRESDSLYPTGQSTGYLASKLAAELYLTAVSQRTALEGIILRVGTPYGPGEPSRKVIPTFLRLAAQGRALRVANGGVAKLNFVHVADVADCVVKAIKGGQPGIYNVASGQHTSLRQLADRVVELSGEPEVQVEVEPAASRCSLGFPALSINKAKRTWRFAPRPLDVGLRNYRTSLTKAGI
jgi:nucleoside-diphosphate-sugar epimerase